jgi:hypothetical protein
MPTAVAPQAVPPPAEAPDHHSPTRSAPATHDDHRQWRQLLESKIQRLEQDPLDASATGDLQQARRLFAQARSLAHQRESGLRRLADWWTGSLCDTAWRTFHEGEAHRVAAMPLAARRLRVREVMFDAVTILDRNDPVLEIAVEGDDAPTRDEARELVRRYRAAWDDRYKRSASYRNRLLQLIAIVTAAVALIVVLGAAGIYTVTDTLELQYPTLEFTALTGARFGVMVAIATFGSAGGLLAGANQVVRLGGVYNPMHLPVLSLVVKIQMGALCGLAGVLAVLGNLLPEVTADRWGTLAGFALVFGASQQLLTQVIDRKVSALVASEPRDQSVRK